MLYLRGITSSFNDIDIMVSEKDIAKVEEIMRKYGMANKRYPNSKYKTKLFLEYDIDGIELDIMAGFIIVNKESDYYFPLKESDPYDEYILYGEVIKLATVKQWHKFYTLMERTDKVKLLRKYVK